MFLPETLINYVFADENDIFFRDDLVQFSLDQYLWFNLKDDYEEVFFIEKESDDYISKTYKAIKKKQGFLSDLFLGDSSAMNQKRCQKWIESCISDKKKIAIVCSLEVFCSIYDKVKKRTRSLDNKGIIVIKVPLVIEKSRRYFLESQAFEYFEDSVILGLRTHSISNMYEYIRQGKGKGCIFLNVLNMENIQALLLNIMMRNTNRYVSERVLKQAAEYLLWYMSVESTGEKISLFSQKKPFECFTFRDLYEELYNEETWKKLIDRASNRSYDSEGYNVRQVFVTRDRAGDAGKCLFYEVPESVYKVNSKDDVDGVLDLIKSIRRTLLEPSNIEDNAAVTQYLGELYSKLINCKGRDIQSLNFILEAILYAVQNLGVNDENTEGIVSVIKKYTDIISASFQYFTICEKIRDNENLDIGVLGEQFKESLKDSEKSLKKMINSEYQALKSILINRTLTTTLNDIKQDEEVLQEITDEKEVVEIDQEESSNGDDIGEIDDILNINPFYKPRRK